MLIIKSRSKIGSNVNKVWRHLRQSLTNLTEKFVPLLKFIVIELIREDQESENNTSNNKLRGGLDKMMEDSNPMITDMYKFIAGASQRKIDKNTEVWKKLTKLKVTPIKNQNRSNRRSRR